MRVKIKKLYPNISNYDLKSWIGWLNDKEVTKYSGQRFSKHTLSTQKNLLNKN